MGEKIELLVVNGWCRLNITAPQNWKISRSELANQFREISKNSSSRSNRNNPQPSDVKISL